MMRPDEKAELIEIAAAMMRGELTCEKGHRARLAHVHFDDVHRWGQRIARVAHGAGRSSDPEPAPDGLRAVRDALDEVAETFPVDEISDAPWVVERGSIAWLIREGEKGPQVGNFILEADARWVAATRNAAGAVPALQATGEPSYTAEDIKRAVRIVTDNESYDLGYVKECARLANDVIDHLRAGATGEGERHE